MQMRIVEPVAHGLPHFLERGGLADAAREVAGAPASCCSARNALDDTAAAAAPPASCRKRRRGCDVPNNTFNHANLSLARPRVWTIGLRRELEKGRRMARGPIINSRRTAVTLLRPVRGHTVSE